jgi:hypothetical protein
MTKRSNRKNRSKLAIFLLAPVMALTFMIGWSLYWIGNKKHNRQQVAAPKIHGKQDILTLMVIPRQEEQTITNS